jgi:predicted ATPase
MSSLDAEHYLLDVRLRRERISSFETYPFSLPAVKELGTLKLHPKVTFIVGENGSGKSTLLEAIATNWGFNPEGGTKNFNFDTRQSHSESHAFLTLGKSVRRAKDGAFFELKASLMWLPRLKSSTLNPRRRHLSSIPTVIDRFTSSRTVSRSLR